MSDDLRASYTFRRGPSYQGAIRDVWPGDVFWRCEHDHHSAKEARRCAQDELDRRRADDRPAPPL